MGLADTPYAVKVAIVELLGERLNPEGTAAAERVDVFYGRMGADTTHQHIIVGELATDYTPETLRADGTLYAYEITYVVDIHINSGQHHRTQQAAEEAIYGLLDRVLTVLVRGDTAGATLLRTKIDNVSHCEPTGDSMTTVYDGGTSEAQYGEVTLNLLIELDRG